ncbi:NAD(P)/FAD-dependent oxidoreductase [Aliikangiella sp. IMCC44632]
MRHNLVSKAVFVFELKEYDVIIVGAGAAGLMCASTAAARGKKTLVIDHANKMAKKVLMSGGGRCNFTNYYVEPENFISHNPHFCKSALSRYTQWDFIALVEKYQIDYYEKTLGQLFCRKSSKDIRDLLLNECQSHGAKIHLKCSIQTIRKDNDSYQLATTLGDVSCRSLVIACGGLSIPTMGASGFGYQVAEQFGHHVYPTRPGLTPLTVDEKLKQSFAELAGNSIDVEVSCGQTSFKEAMLFTHKGLSGPAILQISSYWQPGMPISINLLPHLDCAQWLAESKSTRPEINLKTLLATQFSQSVATYLVSKLNINLKLKQLEQKQIQQIEELLCGWIIYPKDYEGYKVAEVTIGGVDTSEISSKTFESNKSSGLYFIGEVLDVTGHLGGFNFQWAWASAYAAGQYVG